MVKVSISLSLCKEVIELIDKQRGLATRSAYVNSILDKNLREIQNGD